MRLWDSWTHQSVKLIKKSNPFFKLNIFITQYILSLPWWMVFTINISNTLLWLLASLSYSAQIKWDSRWCCDFLLSGNSSLKGASGAEKLAHEGQRERGRGSRELQEGLSQLYHSLLALQSRCHCNLYNEGREKLEII